MCRDTLENRPSFSGIYSHPRGPTGRLPRRTCLPRRRNCPRWPLAPCNGSCLRAPSPRIENNHTCIQIWTSKPNVHPSCNQAVMSTRPDVLLTLRTLFSRKQANCRSQTIAANIEVTRDSKLCPHCPKSLVAYAFFLVLAAEHTADDAALHRHLRRLRKTRNMPASQTKYNTFLQINQFLCLTTEQSAFVHKDFSEFWQMFFGFVALWLLLCILGSCILHAYKHALPTAPSRKCSQYVVFGSTKNTEGWLFQKNIFFKILFVTWTDLSAIVHFRGSLCTRLARMRILSTQSLRPKSMTFTADFALPFTNMMLSGFRSLTPQTRCTSRLWLGIMPRCGGTLC